MMPADLTDAALRYAARGWRVFPCNGKVPAIAGGHGCKDATIDRSTIRRWWLREYRGTNIGIACGHGLLVIDLDEKHGVSGCNGFARLEEQNGYLDTVTAFTPSGGKHLYLSAPPELEIPNSAGKVAPGVNVRWSGGYVIAPPSRVDGKPYCWHSELRPDKVSIAAATAWLLELLTSPPRPKPRPYTPQPGANGCLTRYGEAALDSAVRNILTAPPGKQRDTLNRESFCIGTLVAAGRIPVDLAIASLHGAAMRLTSYDARRPWRLQELERCVNDGLRDGQLHPREVA